METTIPETMQAILLEENGGTPKFGIIPVPKPGPGQVLVHMAAAL